MSGLSWPLPEGIDRGGGRDVALFRPRRRQRCGAAWREPDWSAVHRELRRKGVTLSLLWEEYRADHAQDGYGYSRFCELYRRWEGRLKPTMRQHHFAGERAFVDYAGDTLEIIDKATGEVRVAQVFVGVLGASNYTPDRVRGRLYAEATWTQGLADWIASHVRMLGFFGGVPGQLVCDKLKAGVTKACFHDPQINRTYADLAAHYDTAVIPARPRKPRDKAKAEAGVQLVQRWIVAALRKRRFFSLAELNSAIRELLDKLNAKVSRHLGASRRELFERLDRPALKPLPAQAYEYAEWRERRAGLDYHVEIDKHYYSVPYQLLKQKLWARITARTVEIFYQNQRVASHVRTSGNRGHTTVAEHMPPSHRKYAGLTPAELKRQAGRVGPNTSTLVDLILEAKTHPEQSLPRTPIRGLPYLPRYCPAGQAAWARRPGSSQPARHRDRRAHGHVRALDTPEQLASPPASDARAGAGDHPPEHPSHQRCAAFQHWRASGATAPSISTEEETTCSITRHMTNCEPSSSTEWPMPLPSYRPGTTPRTSATPNG